MSKIREAYQVAAASVAALVRDPRVAAAWPQASALEGFSVGGLAAHLAGQVTMVPLRLAVPEPEGEPVPLLGHYERVKWIGADLDADINVAIREGGEQNAAAGAAAIAEALDEAVRELGALLPAQPERRYVSAPAGPWPLLLDDFLVTRMMEIAVHSDDLAYSVGIPTPALPPEVLDPVLALLSRLAIRRHGAPAVLRALTRAERAPASVSAF